MNSIEFEFCDYENPEHLTALAGLLNSYMADPMGDVPPLTPRQQLHLVDGLANHSHAFVVFIVLDGNFAGLATCFELFSTFNARPYMNIHDVIVDKRYRKMGLGHKLMEHLVLLSKERQYCKITLEVRADNLVAQALYRSFGFNECDPVMHFWTKKI